MHMNAAKMIIATIPESTGEDVKRIRKRLNLSVWDMAEILEISRTTLFRIEKENRQLTPAACLMIQYLQSYASAR